MTQVQETVDREPWRTRQGQPANILDPAWQAKEQALCDGTIVWEGTSRWWHCQKCGYCGKATVIQHVAPIHPRDDLTNAINYFMEKRAGEGLDHELASNQLMFIAAAAIRYAATIPAEQVGRYVREHIVLK